MNEMVVKEYLGNGIEFKVTEGKVYANASNMCKPFGKLFADWKRLKQTEDMILEVSEAMGIPIGQLLIVENGKGSWIHEELVLELAGWLDVKFRRWCQSQITTLLREGSVSLKPTNPLDMLLTMDKESLAMTCLQLTTIVKEKDEVIVGQNKEIIHKENVIIGLVEDIDLATKRQRLNQIIRHGDKSKIADRYNLLYKEFESKYHLNLQLRLERSTAKPKLKSKMDLIDRELAMIPQLYELACKIFHSEVESLKSKWFDTIDSSK